MSIPVLGGGGEERKYPDSGGTAHISFISRGWIEARMADQTPVEGENGAMPPTYEEAKGLTEPMDQKVNIAPSDIKIEMGKEKEKEEEGFKGLSKEELMQFANDPFWVKLRWVLFILFWIIWVAMLAASVVIIIYAPKCPSPEAKQWWQKGPVYKTSVGQFPDINGDKVADLQDVNDNLDYLVGAGVGSLYLTSLLSPNNLEQVKQEYGTMDDWKRLSQALQERGLRVIVDFVPGSTDEHHMWYEEAQAGKGEYASYYKSGTQLDLDNVKVQEELVKVMKFWTANGVDGFLVREANGIPKDLLVKFRQELEQAEADSGVEKVLMVDVLSEPLSQIDGVGAGDPIHLHIDQDLLPDQDLTAAGIKEKLDAYIQKQPCEEEGPCAWPAFTLNTTSHGADKSDALTMLKMLLPGTVVSEAGEELGLSPEQYPRADRESPALQQHLKLYSLLTAKLRHQDAILFGKLKPEDSFVKNSSVFGMVRVKKGSPGYLYLINLGPTLVETDLSDVKYLPDNIRVLDAGKVAAVAPYEAAVEGEVPAVKKFGSSAVPLEPGQAKIFNFVPKFS